MSQYECHVSVDKPDSRTRTEYRALAETLGWHTSCIDGDPEMGPVVYFYFTRHSQHLIELALDMRDLVDILKKAGHQIARTKIEQIVYDRRFR